MQVGDKDGYGRYGYLDGDDERIICHECGKACRSIAGHIPVAHQMRADDYREAHGLPRGTALVSPAISRKMSAKSTARIGSEAWKKFEAKRDPAKASHSRSEESFQRRGVDVESQRERAVENIKGARKKTRPCVVCGRPPIRTQMRPPVCSDLCARINRYRAHSDGARAAAWSHMWSEGESWSAIGRRYGCSHTNVRVTVRRWQEHISDVRELVQRSPDAELRVWERDNL